MKKSQRLLALALALLTGCSMFLSCASDQAEENSTTGAVTSGEPTTAEETVPEETEPEFAADDLGEADFGGAEYVIAGLSNRTTDAVTSEELNGEVINDAQYNAARTVEERFNVSVGYEDLANAEDELEQPERDRLDAERADEMNRRFEDVVLNERAEEKFL